MNREHAKGTRSRFFARSSRVIIIREWFRRNFLRAGKDLFDLSDYALIKLISERVN